MPNGRRGPVNELVRGVRVALDLSAEIVAEVSEVLSLPKVRRKLPALTDEAVEAFLRDIVGRAVMPSRVPQAFRLERDPKDERYINLALAADASYLVTWDRDLLDPMNDEGVRRQFHRPTTLEPPALLRLFPRDPAETAPV